jgi:hypothetical protein
MTYVLVTENIFNVIPNHLWVEMEEQIIFAKTGVVASETLFGFFDVFPCRLKTFFAKIKRWKLADVFTAGINEPIAINKAHIPTHVTRILNGHREIGCVLVCENFFGFE